MSEPVPTPGYVFAVWPVNEVRANLPSILDRFADEGPLSPPVVIGRHRKPEAALVPYRLLVRLLAVYEEHQAPQMMANNAAELADAPESEFIDVEDLT